MKRLPVTAVIVATDSGPAAVGIESELASEFDQVLVALPSEGHNHADALSGDPVAQFELLTGLAGVKNGLVLFIGEDEKVSRELRDEIARILQSRRGFSGLRIPFSLTFLGKELKRAHGIVPAVRVRGLAVDRLSFADGGDEIISVRASIRRQGPRSISQWISMLNEKSSREAQTVTGGRGEPRAWPMADFFVRYIGSLGFLDGVPGLIYCYMDAYWYAFLLQCKVLELTREHGGGGDGEVVRIPLSQNAHRLPMSVLIMAQNEEANMRQCLQSVVSKFDQVVVADSFSEDRTLERCAEFPEVEVYQHQFESWASQRNWMLKNCRLRNQAVFFLDADECVSEKTVGELKENLNGTGELRVSALEIPIEFVFLRRKISRAYRHPPIARIFRASEVEFDGVGAREYAVTGPRRARLRAPLTHRDLKPLAAWIEKHNRNSDREALAYQNRRPAEWRQSLAGASVRARATLWVRTVIWDRMPLFLRTPFYFIYRYVFRLGMLDGFEGYSYCHLHAFWYQALIDVKIMEAGKNRGRNEKPK